MATYKVESTETERTSVLGVLSNVKEVISVNQIAKKAGIGESRARNAILDLEEQGILRRVPIKQFNKHYTRYRYEVLQS